jgi:CheY-like chemotaxis protein
MPEQQRILIIDDSEVVLSRLKERLLEAGYDVITTTQTVGAARYLLRCDLVILDYHMPGIDGAQVLTSLQAATRNSTNPPIFYLYTSDQQVAQQYKDLGFDGSFTQKGDDEALVAQVSAAFRIARLRRLSKPAP